ncbi:kinase-like domain-containing protein [Aspergillus aurantiobrunneus]
MSAPDDFQDFGDFASDGEEADIEMVAEPWERYSKEDNPNVFYPIRLGEVLNERYLVEHKLGHGGGSTVWMALDLQKEKNVALKVMSSSGWAENEIRMHGEIKHSVQDTSHLVLSVATFFLGQHRVLVLPLMGPCMTRPLVRKIPVATRMSAARQLLEALANLHNAGFVHRDLNDMNCMWGVAPLGHLSRSARYKLLGRPLRQIIPINQLWKQGELVAPLKIPGDLRTDEFHLGDFGLAKKLSDAETQNGYPPLPFCSPERLHGKDPSFACDMWSYMILFSTLYLRVLPFFPYAKGGVLSSMVEALGPLPKQWQGSCVYSEPLDSWYDQSQTPDPNKGLASTIAYYRSDADPTEQQHMLDVMSKVFIFCPEKRLTAAQLLQDPSFRAIMDKYGC